MTATNAHITEICSSYPEGKSEGHECMENERRCVYCGVHLWPYPCHGCGHFLTAKRMHDAATGEAPSFRCEGCEP